MNIRLMPLKFKIGFTLVVIVVLWGAFLAYKHIANLPAKIVSYQGASLGETKDQVFYALGVPTDVLYGPKDPYSTNLFDQFSTVATKEQIDKTPLGEKGFNHWQYDNNDKPRIDIKFNNEGKVEFIGCFISPQARAYADSCLVNGVQSLDSEERIIDKLGKPDSETIEGVTKTMKYKKFNMQIFLERKFAYYIVVTNKFSD